MGKTANIITTIFSKAFSRNPFKGSYTSHHGCCAGNRVPGISGTVVSRKQWRGKNENYHQ